MYLVVRLPWIDQFRYIKIQTWLRGLRESIIHYSFVTLKVICCFITPSSEEFYYIEIDLFQSLTPTILDITREIFSKLIKKEKQPWKLL